MSFQKADLLPPSDRRGGAQHYYSFSKSHKAPLGFMLAPHQGMEMTSKRIDYFDPYRVFSAHFWVFETATYCHYYQLYNGPILRVILLDE